MSKLQFVMDANRQFSALLKRARTGGTGTDPLTLAIGLGISELEYFRLEHAPAFVPANLLYKAIAQLGSDTMNEAGLIWVKLQLRRYRANQALKSAS